MANDHREVRTARLLLQVPRASDLAALYRLHSDARVWRHLPSGRHTSVERTESMLERCRQGWVDAGLDDWVVSEAGSGDFVGIGGVDLRRGFAWNVYYRLAPAAQGKGYAQELVAAAREAAEAVRPDLPVVAFLLERNAASRRTAERAGLTLQWRGPEPAEPDAIRLVYADRPLEPAAMQAFRG